MTAQASALVVVFPRGQLSADDKYRLELNGVIAIEADSPADVCQLHLTAPLTTGLINGDAIVRAALEAMASLPPCNDLGAITGAGRVQSSFVKHLAESLTKETP